MLWSLLAVYNLNQAVLRSQLKFRGSLAAKVLEVVPKVPK